MSRGRTVGRSDTGQICGVWIGQGQQKSLKGCSGSILRFGAVAFQTQQLVERVGQAPQWGQSLIWQIMWSKTILIMERRGLTEGRKILLYSLVNAHTDKPCILCVCSICSQAPVSIRNRHILMVNQGTLESVWIYIRSSVPCGCWCVCLHECVHAHLFVLATLNYTHSPGVFTLLRVRWINQLPDWIDWKKK